MPKLPVVGQVGKGPAIAIGVGGVAVAGFLVYRHQKKKQQQSAAVADAQAASAAASAGYGYGYGTYDGQSQYYGGFGAVSDVGGYYAYGQAIGSGGNVAGGNLPGATTTDAQWTQAAIQQLEADGYNAQDVVAALGAYLNGGALTSLQQQIVQSAIAVEGYPPVAPPAGNPTPGTTGGGQTNPGGSATVPPPTVKPAPAPIPVPRPPTPAPAVSLVTVPNVVGMQVNPGIAKLAAAGFGYHSVSGNRNPLYTYMITSQSPVGGSRAAKGTSVAIAFTTHTYPGE